MEVNSINKGIVLYMYYVFIVLLLTCCLVFRRLDLNNQTWDLSEIYKSTTNFKIRNLTLKINCWKKKKQQNHHIYETITVFQIFNV